MKPGKVVIIGAGTAGLTALAQVRKNTDDFVIINGGPYGTTCARVGCMPSKALIEAAHALRKRRLYPEMGIVPGSEPEVDGRAVLERVRSLRDRFVRGVLKATDGLGERSIQGRARITSPDEVEVNGRRIPARAIIAAPGSIPAVPAPWLALGDRLLTSDSLFEMDSLPDSLAVVGLGAIGLEIAQAMAGLGVRVEGFDAAPVVGGVTDPLVADRAAEIIGKDFPLHLQSPVDPKPAGDGVRVGTSTFRKVLVAVGRKPDIRDLGLENLGVGLDERGLPEVDPETMQVGNLQVFLAGDANGRAPILHEAADDGFIAGRNAVEEVPGRYCRRAALGIIFTSPGIARAGARFGELDHGGTVTGEADFSRQGRAMTAGVNRGLLRLYAEAGSGRLLGAEMVAPGAEHLAHLLAWSIQQGLAVSDALRMPFYHPVYEEALRGALRIAAGRMGTRPEEMPLCPGPPVE